MSAPYKTITHKPDYLFGISICSIIFSTATTRRGANQQRLVKPKQLFARLRKLLLSASGGSPVTKSSF